MSISHNYTMNELIEKLGGIREQIKQVSDSIHRTKEDLGRASLGQARTLNGALSSARSELADLIRKETIILRVQENE